MSSPASRAVAACYSHCRASLCPNSSSSVSSLSWSVRSLTSNRRPVMLPLEGQCLPEPGRFFPQRQEFAYAVTWCPSYIFLS